jgi:hypothetical protein
MAQGVRPRSDRQGVCKAAYDFAVFEATDLSDGERDMVRPSAVQVGACHFATLAERYRRSTAISLLAMILNCSVAFWIASVRPAASTVPSRRAVPATL